MRFRQGVFALGAVCVLAFAPAAAAADGNFFSNGSFEGTLAGWTPWQATATVANDGIVGTRAARVQMIPGSDWAFSIHAVPRPVSSSVAGGTYVGGGWIRSDTPGRNVCIRTREYHSGNLLKEVQNCQLSTRAWAQFKPLAYVALRSGDEISTYVFENDLREGDSFEIDGMTLSGPGAPLRDSTPPSTTITAAPSGTVASRSASISFTADEPATFACSLDAAAFAACSSPTALSGLADGTHTFRVRATDTSGNVEATPAQVSWTVDTTGPPAPVLTSTPPASTTSPDASFSFTDAEAGVAFSCTLDAAPAQACSSPQAYTGLSVGQHTFSVRAKDAVGNWSAATSYTWTIASGIPAPGSDVEYFANGDFESGTTGWAVNSAVVGAARLAIVNDGNAGPKAAQVSTTAAGEFFLLASPRAVTSTTYGVTYTYRGSVRADVPGKEVCLRLREREGASDAQLGTDVLSCVTTTSGWQAIPPIAYTAVGTGNQLVTQVVERAGVAGDSFEVDGLSLKSPYVPPGSSVEYFSNGNFESGTTGWAANGAGGSSSVSLTIVGDGNTGPNAARLGTGASGEFFLLASPRAVTSTGGGVTYTFRGSVRSDAPGKQVCLRLRERAAVTDAQVGTDVLSCVTSTTAWQSIPPIAYTATATGNQLVTQVVQTTGGTGSSFEADGLSLTSPFVRPTPVPSGGDPAIAAAGDIACAPGGTVTQTTCQQGGTAELINSLTDTQAVLPLGDEQYECGEAANFSAVYALTWGNFKAMSHPVPGNHEYGDSAACAPSAGEGYYGYFGASAGAPAQGYYSFDVGAWHLIALNSNCAQVGGCGTGSPQETWLRADLAAHTNVCTLAYWHHPRFDAGRVGDDLRTSVFWDDLYAAHADIVLNGHDHSYQRYGRTNPAGVLDTAGPRELIIGTGGEEIFPEAITFRDSLTAKNNTTPGVLRLILHPTSFDLQFLPIEGGTYTDKITSVACNV